MAYEAVIQKIRDRAFIQGTEPSEQAAIDFADQMGGVPGTPEFSGNVWWETYSKWMEWNRDLELKCLSKREV